MNQISIFGPVFAMVCLTFVVWVYMYVRRIHFITVNRIDSQDPDIASKLEVPALANSSNNLKNLFEIPVLFYALSLYLFAANQVDAAYLTAAWIFVLFRVLHSAVHCTINVVMLRFYLYLASTLAVWFIAARATLHYLGS